MILELLIGGALLAGLLAAVYAADDRQVGNDGVVIIDTGGTPVTLDAISWEFRWKPIFKEGRTFGSRGTGRTFVGMDWEGNVTARVRDSGTTPNLMRDQPAGTPSPSTGFSLKTDSAGGGPAAIIAGNGVMGESVLRVREGDYTEYTLQLLSNSAATADLPTRTFA